jgi:hypothetical protein
VNDCRFGYIKLWGRGGETRINLGHPPKNAWEKYNFLNKSNIFSYKLIVSKFSLFPLFLFLPEVEDASTVLWILGAEEKENSSCKFPGFQ